MSSSFLPRQTDSVPSNLSNITGVGWIINVLAFRILTTHRLRFFRMSFDWEGTNNKHIIAMTDRFWKSSGWYDLQTKTNWLIAGWRGQAMPRWVSIVFREVPAKRWHLIVKRNILLQGEIAYDSLVIWRRKNMSNAVTSFCQVDVQDTGQVF